MRFWIVVVAVGLFAPSVYAQTPPTLNLRGITVSLGMTRAQILSKFQDYRLICTNGKDTPLERCDSIMLTSTSTPYKAYGSFAFKNDRLTFSNKYWQDVYSGGTPDQFAEALFNILRQDLGGAHSATYTVTVWENSDPSGNMKKIRFTSGGKSMEISVGEKLRDPDGNIIPTFVNLDEMIGEYSR